MNSNASKPVIGGVLAHELTPWIMSYAGLAFDLLFAPLLLYRRTRWLGFTLAAMFHISNAFIFGLATFPWFSLTLTSLYFSPGWPRKIPFFGRFIPAFSPENLPKETLSFRHPKLITYGILTYAALQILIPFRHFLYPGNVNWTEEGHKFAWHMMLRAKTGFVNFKVVIPGAPEKVIYVNSADYLTQNQQNKMTDQPDLMLQFAHFLKAEYEKQGYRQVQVYANSMMSLNGRPSQPLVDLNTDLAAEKRSLKPYSWILPLEDEAKKR